MKILDMHEGNVIIKPECLLISPFKEIWEADKTKDKIEANNKLKYVWSMADYDSPYFSMPEEEREKMVLRDVFKKSKFKVTKDVKESITKYKELHHTSSMRMVESANLFANKLDTYFRTVELTEVDPKKVTDIFINMPKIVDSINAAKKKCSEEQASGTRVRGGASLGMFEDE